MRFRLPTAIACAALACLLVVPGTAAAGDELGIGTQRVVAPADQPAAAARTTTGSSLIAPAATCPDQETLSAPAAELEAAMLCMTNFARGRVGLGELASAPELGESAAAKAQDVLSCDSFSHDACGRDFTYWIRAVGFIGDGCWHAGENLAWGSGEYGTVRSIFRAWMASATHRRNILGDYDQVGIGLLSGNLEGEAGARVWASHFGSHCGG